MLRLLRFLPLLLLLLLPPTTTTTAAAAAAAATATAATATVASLHLLPLPATPTTHNLLNDKPKNSVPVQGLMRKFRKLRVSDVKVDVA